MVTGTNRVLAFAGGRQGKNGSSSSQQETEQQSERVEQEMTAARRFEKEIVALLQRCDQVVPLRFRKGDDDHEAGGSISSHAGEARQRQERGRPVPRRSVVDLEIGRQLNSATRVDRVSDDVSAEDVFQVHDNATFKIYVLRI